MWCKRPTFQDEYLSTFNQSHATLVDTDDKGIERFAKGVEYELNVLILATGFLLALGENAAPAKLFGIPAAGCSGRYLKDKHGYLHGIATNSLPNVIYLGLGGRESGSESYTAYNQAD
ncbi:hypothetical protein J3E72DRAFT_420605 [Bipolaris maydis]|nr:hypothetical protein J3E72DRAFT_420605 [Bipolaris maydis]